MSKIYLIKGMNCPHCQATVAKVIKSVSGVESVDVNLSTAKAIVAGNFNEQDIVKAVGDAGFKVII